MKTIEEYEFFTNKYLPILEKSLKKLNEYYSSFFKLEEIHSNYNSVKGTIFKAHFNNVNEDVSEQLDGIKKLLALVMKFAQNDLYSFVKAFPEIENVDKNLTAFDNAMSLENSIRAIERSKIANEEKQKLKKVIHFNYNMRLFVNSYDSFINCVCTDEIISIINSNELSNIDDFMILEVISTQFKLIEQSLNTYKNSGLFVEISKTDIDKEFLLKIIDIYVLKAKQVEYQNRIFNIDIYCEDISEDIELKTYIYTVLIILDVLIDNAIKEIVTKELFGEKFNQEIRIIIETKNNNLSISIIDNGRGIEDLENLFNTLYTNKGLFKALEGAKYLDGRIRVHNNEKEGATFTLELPISKNRGSFLSSFFNK